MFIATGLTTLAAAESPSFHVFSWGQVPEGCDNITRMVGMAKASPISQVYNELMATPPGLRAILGWDLHHNLTTHPEDVCLTAGGAKTNQLSIWPDHGIAESQANYDKFFADLTFMGGKADVFVTDNEKNYHKITISFNGGNARWAAIEADPRFPAFATLLGFSDITPLPYGSPEFKKWNSVAGDHFDDVMDEAVFQIVESYLPNVKSSNYGSFCVNENDTIYDYSGEPEYRQSSGAGTHDARRFYGYISAGLAKKKMDGATPFGDSPFAGLLLEINALRSILRGSDRPVHPWIGTYSYDGLEVPDRKVAFCNSPYYGELVRQLACHGCSRVIFWNPAAWTSWQDPEDWNKPEDSLLLNEIAGELNAKLSGTVIGPASEAPIPWNAKVIAGAVQLNNMVVWRFSFAPGIQAIKIYQNGVPKIVVAKEGEVGAYFTHPLGASLDLDSNGMPLYQVTDASQAPSQPEEEEEEEQLAFEPDEGYEPDYDSGELGGDYFDSDPIFQLPSQSDSKASSGKSSGGSKAAKSSSSKSSKKAGKKGGGGGGGGGGGSGGGSVKSASSSKSKSKAKSSSGGGSSGGSSRSGGIRIAGKAAASPAAGDSAAAKPSRSSNDVMKVTIVDVSKLRAEQAALEAALAAAAATAEAAEAGADALPAPAEEPALANVDPSKE